MSRDRQTPLTMQRRSCELTGVSYDASNKVHVAIFAFTSHQEVVLYQSAAEDDQ